MTTSTPATVRADGAASTASYSDASTADDGSVSVAKVVADGTGNWTCSAYVRQNSSAAISLRMSLLGGTTPLTYTVGINYSGPVVTPGSGATATLTNVRNSWYRLTVSGPNNGTGNTLAACSYLPTNGTANQTGNGYMWGLRIDQGTSAASSMLSSSQSANYSPWTHLGNLFAAPGAALAPDGTMTAALLGDSSSIAASAIERPVTIATTSQPWACSAFIKRGSSTKSSVSLKFTGGTPVTYTAIWDWNTLTTSGTGTATKTPLANGWYRIGVSGTNTGASNTAACSIAPTDLTVSNTGTVYAWGPQIEQSAFPTSYISTGTVSATRSAETVTGNASSWISSVSGTLHALFDVFSLSVTGGFDPVRLDDGTSSNTVQMRASGGKFSTLINSGGSAQWTSTGFAGTANTLQSDVVGYLAGSMVHSQVGNDETSSSGSVPSSLNRIVLGGTSMAGHVRRVNYVGNRLETSSTRTLAELSSVRRIKPTVSLTVSTQNVIAEQGSVSVTAALSEPATAALSIPYAVSGTSSHHDLVNGSFDFAVGQDRSTIKFNVTNPGTTTDETIIVTLGTATGATTDSSNATQTVTLMQPVFDFNFGSLTSSADLTNAPFNQITFSRTMTPTGTDSTAFDSNGILQKVGAIPRIDFDPLTGVARGFLVEEARTNLLLNSEQLQLWTQSQVSVTANAATAPDGTATADQIVESAASSIHRLVYDMGSATSASTYTFTIFGKASGRDMLDIALMDSTQANYVNGKCALSGGGAISVSKAGTATVMEASVQPLKNGWYRCRVTAAISAGIKYVVVGVQDSTGANSYAGNGVSGAVVWGAQLELGASETSYIPTGAATVTRGDDLATISSLESLGFNTTAGTLAAEAWMGSLSTVSNQSLMTVDGGSTSDQLAMRRMSTKIGRLRVSASGVSADVSASEIWDDSDLWKMTASYSSSGLVLVDSSLVPATGTSTLPSPASWTLRLGGGVGTSTFLNGSLRRARIYNRALSREQLSVLSGR